MSSDTQGIVALTSPSNKAENGQSRVNSAKRMQQEQDEGESDKDDNQEEKDARRKPAKCLQQELDKEDDNDTVEGGNMMTEMEFTDMDGTGFVDLPGIETNSEDEATEYFNMAHDLLEECKADCNISSLNTAIYNLEWAAFTLLIRFIYTVDAKDVHKAFLLHRGEPPPGPGHPAPGPGHPAPGARSTGPVYVIHLWIPKGRLHNGIKSAIKPETSADHSGHVLLVSSHLYPRPSVGILRVSSLRIPLASPLRFSGLEVALTAEETLSRD
ncbi:hypothetical protein B0H13DRAFT_2340934 [Mycena leptocephala]|nr:hypothetical protein B0H13DRAFT_2340934 [Mycena leptocephala]